MKTITNGSVSIAVEDHGAELSSIKYKGREYLWGAYPEFWKRHSPVLFPIVGSVWQGEYRSNSNTYKLGQHGIARDMDFVLVKEEENYLEYELRSTEETLTKYPYPFVLRIGYRLHDNSIDVVWKVTNPSESDMYFQIGAHPAFHWPLLSNEAIEGGVQAMNKELAVSNERGYFLFDKNVKEIVCTPITQAGCVDVEKKHSIALDGGYLHLDNDLFLGDALILEDCQVKSVTLCDEAKKPYLTLSWDAPLVGLWSPPGKNAPFVCIEPWYGRTDRVGYEGNYEDKDWIQCLSSKATFETKYTITLE